MLFLVNLRLPATPAYCVTVLAWHVIAIDLGHCLKLCIRKLHHGHCDEGLFYMGEPTHSYILHPWHHLDYMCYETFCQK